MHAHKSTYVCDLAVLQIFFNLMCMLTTRVHCLRWLDTPLSSPSRIPEANLWHFAWTLPTLGCGGVIIKFQVSFDQDGRVLLIGSAEREAG